MCSLLLSDRVVGVAHGREQNALAGFVTVGRRRRRGRRRRGGPHDHLFATVAGDDGAHTRRQLLLMLLVRRRFGRRWSHSLNVVFVVLAFARRCC